MKSAETALQNFQPGSNLKAMEALAAGKRKIYETVLSRYDLAVSEEANTFPDAKIVSRAEPPIVPSSPKTALWLLVGFGLSTCLGIMSALVVEHRSGKSDTYKTAAKEAGVPILGVVPPQDSSPATKQLDMFLRDERIRDIRNQLLSPTGRCVTIAISSSLPGKHKSSIAVSLARSFRSAGLATLLIDADTVCPDVTEILGLKHVEAGFVDVIQRSAPPETAIQSVEGIYVLPCSRNEGRASPDFVSSQLAAVLERLQTKLDVIIIDAPPLLAASSALVVASVTDHTIVVTEQRKIPELRLCLELLQERDINVAGLVVIGTDKGQKHFFSKAALSPYVRNAPLPNASSEPTITSATSTRGDDQNELGALQGIETGGSNASVRRLPSKASLG
jgi:Mrp family chromosome partitioning ATPase